MKLFRSKQANSLTELVKACQKQDHQAQVQLYERYKGRLMGICLRYARTEAEAEDIFQEGILKIFDRIGDLKKPESVDSWVKTVMIRYAIDYYNQVTKGQKQLISTDYIETEWESDDYQNLFSKLHTEVLLETINELPEGYRMVINLYFVDGYSHAEIAQLLGISEGTSRSQLLRGRNLLIKKLDLKGVKQHEKF
ncbi:sigma-70 family RNA polymerase sigma factor [Spirosoma terrae]|uniref:Sigma-70 family RNA polymerase sigma factor n=1 Tax=Spirosoma terrae TaxID=1968276 RepID=A0A6L9LBW8_9BACT|nr:sigma-70 family RNA polymerase sigma factor [Spirosoma terrae]NDU94329.1 sigma-70 family RNA polymerase sigma factor [Spirosoma terrae]